MCEMACNILSFAFFICFFARFVDLIHGKKAALQQLQVAARTSLLLLLLIVIAMLMLMLMLMLTLF